MSVSVHQASAYKDGWSSPAVQALIRPIRTERKQIARHSRERWKALDRTVPAYLRPIVKAYLLGYASSVAPRILNALLSYFASYRRQYQGLPSTMSDGLPFTRFCASVRHILRSGLELHRFPAFCAALVGGSTLLKYFSGQETLSGTLPCSVLQQTTPSIETFLKDKTLFHRLLAQCAPGLSLAARTRLSHWLASFVAAYGGLCLLQSKQTSKNIAASSSTKRTNDSTAAATTRESLSITTAATKDTSSTTITIPCAGRTLDLTLFAATRALDVIVGELWARRKERRVAAGSWTGLDTLIGRLADSAIFATSSALVMWAWFYVPSRLPQAYNKWITSAAAVDSRLIDALRLCRAGQLQYGKDLGPNARILEGMARDYKWPLQWGDPAATVPFPCTMVHMDCGPSCEYHALVRFLRSWRWSMTTYLPLSMLLVLRKPNRNLRGIGRALFSAMRSSVFLGTFITLFFYGVCLARSRIGPLILGKSVAARQAIDSGLCTAVGCGLCGWSILIERASRRKDMGLFVASRALATLFPRHYALDKQWRETLVFAASTAVVFTAIQENPKRVRGVLGKILKIVLAP